MSLNQRLEMLQRDHSALRRQLNDLEVSVQEEVGLLRERVSILERKIEERSPGQYPGECPHELQSAPCEALTRESLGLPPEPPAVLTKERLREAARLMREAGPTVEGAVQSMTDFSRLMREHERCLWGWTWPPPRAGERQHTLVATNVEGVNWLEYRGTLQECLEQQDSLLKRRRCSTTILDPDGHAVCLTRDPVHIPRREA